jgi:hypothetical protein
MFKLFNYIINIIKNFILKIEPQIDVVVKKVFTETEHKFVSATRNMFDFLYHFEHKWDVILTRLEDNATYAIFGIFEGKWLRKIIAFEKRSEIMFRKKEDKLASYFVNFVISIVRLVAKVFSFIKVAIHVDNKLHIIMCEKEAKLASRFLKYLRSGEFFYLLLLSMSFAFFILMMSDLNYYNGLLLQKDALINNFNTYYYYYFMSSIFLFGFIYYSITYIQYKEDYLSKFFILLFSVAITYFVFYYYIFSANTQVPEITELLISNSSYSVSPTSDYIYIAIKACSILLVYLLVMYYFLRNTISIISELLIDYMDPEHDMIMKLFKMFIYTLVFLYVPYIFSDVVIL